MSGRLGYDGLEHTGDRAGVQGDEDRDEPVKEHVGENGAVLERPHRVADIVGVDDRLCPIPPRDELVEV